jgi:peptidoglycan-N-acetylglucosamine deacetylase
MYEYKYLYKYSSALPHLREDRIAQYAKKPGYFNWVEKYLYVFGGPYNKAQISLTFDDGPDLIYTPRILDILKKYQVKATFFLLGENAEKYPEVVKRMVQEDHVVANHSYHHLNFQKLNNTQFHEQVQKTQAVLQKLTGYFPKLLRPPYGEINEKQLAWATDQGIYVIMWNVDSLDWKGLTAEQVMDNVLPCTYPGSIVLQHSTGRMAGSVKALDLMIPSFKKRGAQLVTVPKLLGIPKELR